MKNRLVILTVIGVCLVSTALALELKKKTVTAVPQEPDPIVRASMREKARQKGHYIGMVHPLETTRYYDAESLVKSSPLIVTGIVQEQKSLIPPTNDRLIVTAHEVLVQNVLKGAGKAGTVIQVETLGGAIRFEDGTTAELKTPDIIKDPQLGKTYLLFLRPQKSAYRLVGGPQGLFELSPNGKITPQVPADDVLMTKYGGKAAETFIRTVQELAAKSK